MWAWKEVGSTGGPYNTQTIARLKNFFKVITGPLRNDPLLPSCLMFPMEPIRLQKYFLILMKTFIFLFIPLILKVKCIIRIMFVLRALLRYNWDIKYCTYVRHTV